MTLKTIEEHNQGVRNWLSELDGLSARPRLNGIACPKCGAEMIDTAPNIVLTSNPSQYNVGCSKCDYIGTRL